MIGKVLYREWFWCKQILKIRYNIIQRVKAIWESQSDNACINSKGMDISNYTLIIKFLKEIF